MTSTPYKLLNGDCLEVLKTTKTNSIDAIVTDPPYGLSFMGKNWDHGVPGVAFWKEALRVLKPGGYILAFGGSRTYHRLATAIEDAGFGIRDQIMWIYGSGFPKSLNVSKAIDKMHGAEREVVGQNTNGSGAQPHKLNNHDTGDTGIGYMDGSGKVFDVTAPATDEAKQWDGWGTALKPAHEPIVMARKPLEKGLTVAQNVLKYGTGAINVDACRIETKDSLSGGQYSGTERADGNCYGRHRNLDKAQYTQPAGRWPANVIHDGSDEVLAHFPNTTSGKVTSDKDAYGDGSMFLNGVSNQNNQHGDAGSAARFFYCAKASKADRDGGCRELPIKQTTGGGGTNDPNGNDVCGKYGSVKSPARNHHPTVKPSALMRYLCKLVTPPGGIVLDPFMGSGSTGKAAILEGFEFIGIDLDPDYVEIAEKRISAILTKEPLFQNS